MGLDMYLKMAPKVESIEELREIEKTLSIAFFEGDFEKELNAIKEKKGFIWNFPVEFEDSITKENYKKATEEGWFKVSVQMRIGYWRKFNALHNWFVAKVQNGEDECNPHIVTLDHLKLLEGELKEINKENASKILPTGAGFFFGGTDYDDYYWQDVERLKGEVIYYITQIEHREKTLIYRSSW